VREDVFDEDFLVSIVYFRNQAVVIAFDIEDRASPYGVSVPKSRARFREVTPVGFPRQFVPLFQGRLGIGMCFPELAQSPFADDSHSAIPFNGYTRILRALGQAWSPTDLKARHSRSKPLYRLLAAGDQSNGAGRAHSGPIKIERAAGNRIDRSSAGHAGYRPRQRFIATYFDRRQGGTMPDIDRAEKLIVTLGQRIREQNEILRMIAKNLQGVESHLCQIAVSSNPAPNYQRPLIEYADFDWPSIGATVLNRDDDGATAVEWNGQIFTRRSPSNRFQEAVWFSRHLGQDSDGNKRYARLISFKALSDAEPIAANAKKAIRG
jgi:DdrB-like protein